MELIIEIHLNPPRYAVEDFFVVMHGFLLVTPPPIQFHH